MPDLGNSVSHSSLFGHKSAVFWRCQTYRYRLDRLWDEYLPPLAFGMLNPSTADHERNDATIERCERRARALGFGSLVVWNLFAFRTTNPALLKEQTDPVGPQNDEFIYEALIETKSRQGTVVVGWGANGDLWARRIRVLEIAQKLQVDLYCLGVTLAGQPRHPLYVSYQSKLMQWKEDTIAAHVMSGHYEGPNAAPTFDKSDLIPS